MAQRKVRASRGVVLHLLNLVHCQPCSYCRFSTLAESALAYLGVVNSIALGLTGDRIGGMRRMVVVCVARTSGNIGYMSAKL